MSPPPVKPEIWDEGLLCSASSGQKLFAFAGGTISKRIWSYNNLGECFLELDSRTLPCSLKTYCQATDSHPEVA